MLISGSWKLNKILDFARNVLVAVQMREDENILVDILWSEIRSKDITEAQLHSLIQWIGFITELASLLKPNHIP